MHSAAIILHLLLLIPSYGSIIIIREYFFPRLDILCTFRVANGHKKIVPLSIIYTVSCHKSIVLLGADRGSSPIAISVLVL